jgi:hypothetical protein
MRNIDGSLPKISFMQLNPAAPKPYSYIDNGTILSNIVYHGETGVPYNGAAPDLGAFEAVTSNSALPVNLLSFSAYMNNNNVTLNWKTTSEINNRGWDIERASDINNALWTSIGFVDGRTSSTSVNSYFYPDNNVSAGTYYYRLKQVDLDGKVTISKVVLVKIESGKQHAEVVVFPNPVKSSATIRYTVPASARVSLAIYNQLGQLINTLFNEGQQAGTYQSVINGHNLASGKYYLKLALGEEVITNTFIKE